MKKVMRAALVGAALVVGHLHIGAAETPKFRYVTSVYFDDKGAGLNRPEGVACDAKGRLVIGDTGNDRVLRFNYHDKALSGGGEIKIPELTAPSRVQLNSKGDIYALDARQRRVVHLGPEGAFKDTVSYDGVPPPSTVVAKSFAIDAADGLYVLDVFGARVLVVSAEGQFQKALLGARRRLAWKRPVAGFHSPPALFGAEGCFRVRAARRRPDCRADHATELGDVQQGVDLHRGGRGRKHREPRPGRIVRGEAADARTERGLAGSPVPDVYQRQG
jgi:hypothetical protein